MRRRAPAAALALLAAAATPPAAEAGILSEATKANLCTRTYGGVSAVDPDKLAFEIVKVAGATEYLDRANDAGVEDGVINLRSVGGRQSDAAYMVTRTGNPAFKDVSAALAQALVNEVLPVLDPKRDGLKVSETLTYRAVRRDGLAVVRNPSVDRVFEEDAPYVILCQEKKTAEDAEPTPDTRPGERPRVAAARIPLRIRGAVPDLTVSLKDIKAAKPATIGFDKDEVADKSTFAVKGVAGLHFGDKHGVYDAIPYLAYERKRVTGAGDIEKISPGLLLGYRIETYDYSVHSRLEASYVFDEEQDAEQGKLRLYISPAFRLGESGGTLFGTPLKGLGDLRLRPDLTLIGDASTVPDAGTSTELAGVDDYYGLGGELSLRLGHVAVPNFTLKLGVRYLELFGEIGADNATRYYGALEYSPASTPFGIALTFSEGENDDTFQREDKFGLSLTVRY